VRTRTGKPIPAKIAVIQGRTAKVWLDQGGDLSAHIHGSIESVGWDSDKVINTNTMFDADNDERWVFWTVTVMIRDE